MLKWIFRGRSFQKLFLDMVLDRAASTKNGCIAKNQFCSSEMNMRI
jgi:hypothetical protein